ncbi:unnamed protein product [Amoebophrya sp. A120]|nr:unnamed protein product [Amoebophrya sp. A120]|eukprot:GSA120T00011746001.1
MREFFERVAMEAGLLRTEFEHLANTDKSFLASVGRAGLDTMVMVSDVTQCVAFFVLLYNLRRFRSLVGVSGQTVAAIAVARVVNFLGVFVFEGGKGRQLSFWLFTSVDLLATSVACFNLYSFVQLRQTYNAEKDDFLRVLLEKFGFQGKVAQYGGIYIVAFVFSIAWKLFVNSGLVFNVLGGKPAETISAETIIPSWSELEKSFGQQSTLAGVEEESLVVGWYTVFADSLVMCGMLAQMHLTRRLCFIRALLGDFVILMAAHKLGLFCWWLLFGQVVSLPESYTDINTLRYQLLSFEFIHICIYFDFWVFWVRSGAASWWWTKRQRDEFVMLYDNV